MENLDHSLFYLINTLGSTSWLDIFFPAITDLHKSPYFALIVVPLFLGFFIKDYGKRGLLLFFGLIVCLGLSDFTGGQIKKYFQRARPGDNPEIHAVVKAPYSGFSFVSNHATNLFAMATYTSFFVPVLAIPTFAVAGLVAYSRVYNGVHYPGDVFFGAMLGILIAYLICRLIVYFSNRGRTRWF